MTQSPIPIKAFGVSVVVLRKKGPVAETLIMRRNSPILHGQWCQVAGSSEPGEAGWQTALRELKEETGLVPDSLYAGGYCEQFYHAAAEAIEVAPLFVAFVGAAADVTINFEHSEYRWVPISAVTEYLSTPNQCEMFEFVDKYFVKQDPAKWTTDRITNP